MVSEASREEAVINPAEHGVQGVHNLQCGCFTDTRSARSRPGRRLNETRLSVSPLTASVMHREMSIKAPLIFPGR